MRKIRITDGSTILRAELNDTVAARDFEKRLPLVVSGYDSGMEYCCTAASGVFDPTERQTGWKNGDISVGGGWFALLYSGQEQSDDHRNMMIIGHINDDDLPLVGSLPKRVTLTISLED